MTAQRVACLSATCLKHYTAHPRAVRCVLRSPALTFHSSGHPLVLRLLLPSSFSRAITVSMRTKIKPMTVVTLVVSYGQTVRKPWTCPAKCGQEKSGAPYRKKGAGFFLAWRPGCGFQGCGQRESSAFSGSFFHFSFHPPLMKAPTSTILHASPRSSYYINYASWSVRNQTTTSFRSYL